MTDQLKDFSEEKKKQFLKFEDLFETIIQDAIDAIFQDMDGIDEDLAEGMIVHSYNYLLNSMAIEAFYNKDLDGLEAIIAYAKEAKKIKKRLQKKMTPK